MLTVAGLAVIVASVPVALLGAGWLIASALKIHQGWAMLLTAGVAIVLGGLVAGLAGMRLSHSFDSFRRSRKQLWLNLAWVRTVLVASASAPASATAPLTAAVCRKWKCPRLFKIAPMSTSRAGIAPADAQQSSPTTMSINVHTIRGEWDHLCILAGQRWSQLTAGRIRYQTRMALG